MVLLNYFGTHVLMQSQLDDLREGIMNMDIHQQCKDDPSMDNCCYYYEIWNCNNSIVIMIMELGPWTRNIFIIFWTSFMEVLLLTFDAIL